MGFRFCPGMLHPIPNWPSLSPRQDTPHTWRYRACAPHIFSASLETRSGIIISSKRLASGKERPPGELYCSPPAGLSTLQLYLKEGEEWGLHPARVSAPSLPRSFAMVGKSHDQHLPRSEWNPGSQNVGIPSGLNGGGICLFLLHLATPSELPETCT